MVNKIFITLGSQKFQFNRLLKAVDELCEKGTVDAEECLHRLATVIICRRTLITKSFWTEKSSARK